MPPQAIPPADQAAAPEASPLDGPEDIVAILAQGAGSVRKALVTFTLRNNNDYAVKDIEIACRLQPQGRQPFDRTARALIPDTVNMKSRKTFAPHACRFTVNINASQARCSLGGRQPPLSMIPKSLPWGYDLTDGTGFRLRSCPMRCSTPGLALGRQPVAKKLSPR